MTTTAGNAIEKVFLYAVKCVQECFISSVLEWTKNQKKTGHVVNAMLLCRQKILKIGK